LIRLLSPALGQHLVDEEPKASFPKLTLVGVVGNNPMRRSAAVDWKTKEIRHESRCYSDQAGRRKFA